ncbi:MAG: hypothetical protein IJ939_02245, partial [Clostridia bacterium]|nr:hypothetical protein [Clostridia bacterium]
MSVRTRRQMVFSFFIVALVVAVIAGAAGYATGYGVESAKRIKLMEENKLLTEKNAELSAIEIDMEEKNALAAENEELKAEIEAIKAEKTALEEKVTELEGTLSDTQETLSETESALSDAEAEAAEGENGSQSKFMDKLTKWFIIGIVGVLVIMGVMMLLVPKNSKKYDSDEDEEDEDEDKGEETGVEAST